MTDKCYELLEMTDKLSSRLQDNEVKLLKEKVGEIYQNAKQMEDKVTELTHNAVSTLTQLEAERQKANCQIERLRAEVSRLKSGRSQSTWIGRIPTFSTYSALKRNGWRTIRWKSVYTNQAELVPLSEIARKAKEYGFTGRARYREYLTDTYLQFFWEHLGKRSNDTLPPICLPPK